MTAPVKYRYKKNIFCKRCGQPATMYKPNAVYCGHKCYSADEQKRRRARRKAQAAP